MQDSIVLSWIHTHTDTHTYECKTPLCSLFHNLHLARVMAYLADGFVFYQKEGVGFPRGAAVKNQLANAGGAGWILGQEDLWNRETHSCMLAWEIPLDRETWQATVQGVAKSQTWLSNSARRQEGRKQKEGVSWSGSAATHPRFQPWPYLLSWRFGASHLDLLMPQFPALYNEDNSSTYLRVIERRK